MTILNPYDQKGQFYFKKTLNKRRTNIRTFKKSITILYPRLLVEVELKRTSKRVRKLKRKKNSLYIIFIVLRNCGYVDCMMTHVEV
jgi:hypothetical protein